MNNFDVWNELKKKIHSQEKDIFGNTREIWWCSLGLNIGTELYGKNELFERPVLILKVYNKDTIKVVPLTSKVKKGKYYIKVEYKGKNSYANLSQTKTISTKRLSRKIGRIDITQFEAIKTAYKATL